MTMAVICFGRRDPVAGRPQQVVGRKEWRSRTRGGGRGRGRGATERGFVRRRNEGGLFMKITGQEKGNQDLRQATAQKKGSPAVPRQ